MKRRVILGALISAMLLGGCASLNVDDRISSAEQIAGRSHFSKIQIPTRYFDLVAFVGPKKHSDVLRVYIEGDGFAWVKRYEPSKNPTPTNPVALKLAVLDTYDVVYLARPCQYVTTNEEKCNPRYWTSARFSPEIVGAMNDAITRLKQSAGAERIMLIGYSGGGAIAALIAANRNDVVHLVTVAGNLDPVAWARWHSVPGLRGSLNPKDQSKLAGVRQTHFVGEKDRIVPVEIYRSYRSAFPESANITMKMVPQADHGCCWEDVWPSLLKELQ